MRHHRQVARRVWVYRTVLDAILSGALPPGARLPAARQLAADWGVARGAVDEAFEQLQIEGWLQRRVGDGSYISERPPVPAAARAAAPTPPLSQSAQRVLHRFAPYLGRPRQMEQSAQLLRPVPLHPRAPMVDNFPMETVPEGDMLVLMNNDKPGVIGGTGTLLGESGINIARMQFGRESAGGRAMSVVSIDSHASEAVIERLKKLPNVLSIKQIRV